MVAVVEKRVGIRYEVAPRHPSWVVVDDETMPESVIHDEAVRLLWAILAAFAARAARGAAFRNLAVRWVESDARIGVDPDVSFYDPALPAPQSLRSVRTWLPGHAPPVIAIEVVSETRPEKDYSTAPERYASCGVDELWVFDPLLAGPTTQGGPFRVQIWAREDGDLERVYAGDGPAHSRSMNAWLVPSNDGKQLRIAEDAAGQRLWLTAEEEERHAKEAAIRDGDQERRAKEEALRRVAELEAQLAARR